MNGIFKYRENQPVVWFHRDTSKSNMWCLYCGEYLGANVPINSNKEHLFAREFVPKGKFSGSCFNFIFRSCTSCNTEKSSYERHVSSLTLINTPERSKDEDVNRIAMHKASNDYHPDRPGKLVINTNEKHSVSLGESIKLGMVSPPQLNDEFVKKLSLCHVQGMFSLLTSKDPQCSDSLRLLPANQFWYFDAFPEQDWGNEHLVEISKRVSDWPCHCNISTAGGFIKVVMRKSLESGGGWFWALEWNKYLRVVGGISLPNEPQDVFLDLPDLRWKSLGLQNGAYTRYRQEQPLHESQDILFEGNVVPG